LVYQGIETRSNLDAQGWRSTPPGKSRHRGGDRRPLLRGLSTKARPFNDTIPFDTSVSSMTRSIYDIYQLRTQRHCHPNDPRSLPVAFFSICTYRLVIPNNDMVKACQYRIASNGSPGFHRAWARWPYLLGSARTLFALSHLLTARPSGTQPSIMSEVRRKFSTIRRPSTILEVLRSSYTPDLASRPFTPSRLGRATRRIRGFYDEAFNDKTPTSDRVRPPSRSSTPSKSDEPPPRPTISKVAKTFASAMSTPQLSDFLIWFLYYDVVDLPSSPDEWFESFKTTEMRG
jgi:hypothetical protein